MRRLKLFFLLCLVAAVTAGCSISVKTKDTSGVDGGVFVSLNKGETWKQIALIPTVTGAPGSISSQDVGTMSLDPSDSLAVYFGSASDGLYYTYNVGNGWTHADGLPKGKVNAVAVSKDNKCHIYAAIGNKLYRSDDCNRSWQELYYDNDPQVEISALAIDHYDANKIYIGTSRGEIIKSLDRGTSWQSKLRAGYRIMEIILSPQDSRMIFASTNGDGLKRSSDGGETWDSLKEKMSEFKNANKIVDFDVSVSDEGLIFVTTAYGLLKSSDNGDSWAKIELITPEKDAIINALAVNPKDPKEIYYVTNTTFYSSFDGGLSWMTRKLPSSRGGWKLMIKPDETNVIFMGMKKYTKSRY